MSNNVLCPTIVLFDKKSKTSDLLLSIQDISCAILLDIPVSKVTNSFISYFGLIRC